MVKAADVLMYKIKKAVRVVFYCDSLRMTLRGLPKRRRKVEPHGVYVFIYMERSFNSGCWPTTADQYIADFEGHSLQ